MPKCKGCTPTPFNPSIETQGALGHRPPPALQKKFFDLRFRFSFRVHVEDGPTGGGGLVLLDQILNSS